jgi:hypothetical protein
LGTKVAYIAGMRRFSLVLATLVATIACSSPATFDPDDVEDGVVVDPDKADNYYSLVAREYTLTGTSSVTVAAGTSMDDVKQLITLKHIGIAWFLDNWLVDKEDDDANHAYGGFSAMVKTGSYEDLAITKTSDTTYSFKFSQEIAGKNNLMQASPFNKGTFSVEIGKPSNDELTHLTTNEEWYRQAPWDSWDPTKVDASKKETLKLTIKAEDKSSDAWFDYGAMFADGKLDIDIFFGWDYYENYHLKESEEVYNWLINSKGFKSPVKKWADYDRKSGPLTKTLSANGKDVTVEVRLIVPMSGTDTDPDTDAGGKVLENEVRDSVKKRDVIMYSGHSGPFYGFALANWNKTDEGDFDDSDIITADMATKYQLVLAEGCDTYMLGNAFLQNPNKNGKNVDVITTTSFADEASAGSVKDLLTRLLETDSAGNHRPRTVKAFLSQIGSESTAAGFTTEYGVQGIDDDPHLHPYANEDAMCTSCKTNADCGGAGNSCITIGHSGKRCAPACTDDSGCPDGYACKQVASASANTIYANMCVPANNRCE